MKVICWLWLSLLYQGAEDIVAKCQKWHISPFSAGMQAIFEIKKCFPNVHKPRPFGEVRQYYIAAEEVIWDYGPTEINQYTGKKLVDDR